MVLYRPFGEGWGSEKFNKAAEIHRTPALGSLNSSTPERQTRSSTERACMRALCVRAPRLPVNVSDRGKAWGNVRESQQLAFAPARSRTAALLASGNRHRSTSRLASGGTLQIIHLFRSCFAVSFWRFFVVEIIHIPNIAVRDEVGFGQKKMVHVWSQKRPAKISFACTLR